MKQIYLDYAATTPVDPQVLEVMLPYFSEKYGNPGALYELGREAKKVITEARKKVARILAAHENEIIFTAGGTESINLAILGYARRNQLHGEYKGHIITTNSEHYAVLNACAALQHQGFDVTYLPVDKDGLVKTEQVARAIRSNTILVSVIYANNEIGTIQPIAEIGALIKRVNDERKKNNLPYLAYHSDACQTAGYLNIHPNEIKVDLLTINGSKIYGPKGTGILYVRDGISLEPIIYGGGQEKGLRGGTENVPGIVGFAKALELVVASRQKESHRLIKLRDYFIDKLSKKIPQVLLNGHPTKRLPNNINFSVLGIEGESLVLYLDAKGISCSTGSACSATSLEPSHVILALGRKAQEAHGSLRVTLGKETTKKDLDYTLSVLPQVVKRLRSISAVKIKNHGKKKS